MTELGALRAWRFVGISVVAGALLSIFLGSRAPAGAVVAGCNADGDCFDAPAEMCDTNTPIPGGCSPGVDCEWEGTCTPCGSVISNCSECTGGGAPACTLCMPGLYPNLGECDPCQPGEYGPDGLSCSPCDPGSVSGSAAQACDACPGGTYTTDGVNCLTCSTCSWGEFESAACTATSDTVCTPCATCAVG